MKQKIWAKFNFPGKFALKIKFWHILLDYYFYFIILYEKYVAGGGVKLILLDRKTPNSILLIEALLRRLDPMDADFVYFKDMLMRLKFGYEGEQRVDREWFEMPYLNEHYLFLNYEVHNEFGFSHQIDTLLLTKNFLLILEVKNISGRIDYEESKHQFLRKRPNGLEDTLTNPIDQLIRHEEYFQRFLSKMRYSLPIEKVVIMANPSTIIGNVPNTVPFLHASGLRSFVKACMIKHPSQLTTSQLDKLAKLLLAKIESRNYDLNISLDRIRKGVLCEHCDYQIQMNYSRGYWHCPNCGNRSKKALLRALDDYRLLINNQITNKEFREFFGVKSMDTVSKILTRSSLIPVGNKKGRYYIIPKDILK